MVGCRKMKDQSLDSLPLLRTSAPEWHRALPDVSPQPDLPDQTGGGGRCAYGLRRPWSCALGSGRLKNRVDRYQFSSQEVLDATQSLVAQSPTVHNPVGFSTMDQTTVEHWDGRRWRVSGYIDSKPEPGVRLRTLYFAVVLNNGKDWGLEDLQLQSMEFGGGSGGHRN